MKKVCLFLIFLGYGIILYQLNVNGHEYYTGLLLENMNQIAYGNSAPRGRILDRNGKILVDNIGTLNIVYHKPYQMTFEKELEIAKKLSTYINETTTSENQKKNYYLALHNNGNDLITQEEWELWEKRELTNEDIKQMKWDRITEDMISYDNTEEKVIYLFSLMNEGYIYQDKTLLRDVSEEVAASIVNLEIPSLFVSVGTKRYYPYGDMLRTIFGDIGYIQENVDDYLNEGYALDDIVGVSGLEKEYESLLRGKKAKYTINSDNSLTLLEEEVEGKDVILNLDVDMELTLIDIMKKEMNDTSRYKTCKYFHDAYAFIGDPSTGGILALIGLRRLDNGDFQDITITSFTSSYAMGSVVKGASNTVGYLTNAIEIDKKMKDSCVKLYSQNQKCSYTSLGYIDDITALKTSSNYFQFITAIGSTGQKYQYNMQFDVTKDNFNTYREVFASYGLGSKTGIDFPIESTGMKGSIVAGDLLLNLAIGQYDTYTPISLLQYINTIAMRGNRYALRFKKNDYTSFMGQVNLDNFYFDRIIEGMYQVFHGGTASWYVSQNLNAVGKTGTSESFYDSNFDGIVDVSVINSTLAFYYPREEPKYSIVIVAPYITDSYDYAYPFTSSISKMLTNTIS